VSQVERGERALKKPKLESWAPALEISYDPFEELWFLSQGMIWLDGRRVFYADHPEALGDNHLGPQIDEVLEANPDIEPVYRLASRIVETLKTILPLLDISLDVDGDDKEPPYLDGFIHGQLTDLRKAEMEEFSSRGPLPMIHGLWGPQNVKDRIERWIQVPFIEKDQPVRRPRGEATTSEELETLVGRLSALERERVRGYVDALIENRGAVG